MAQALGCPHCGSTIRAGQRFCGSCGAALSINCPSCGAYIHPGDRFCKNCGSAASASMPQQPAWGQQPSGLGQQPQPPPQYQQPQSGGWAGYQQQAGYGRETSKPQRQGHSPWLTIGIVILVLLVGVGAAFVLTSGMLSHYISGKAGKYVSDTNPNNYIELKSDGTYFNYYGGIGTVGEWEDEGDQILFTQTAFGTQYTIKARVVGNKIIDPSTGDTLTKR
jgi:predicted nucleic acid-binding Zn ribbon protein